MSSDPASALSYDLEKSTPNYDDSSISAEALEDARAFYERYPNRWCYIREQYLRDAASEFFGTMIMLIVGAGVDCQVTLSASKAVASTQRGDTLSASLAWAAGAASGVWVASGSGGHINPAVTLTFALFRRFPWRKVPIYILAQTAGAWAGGMIVYIVYHAAIMLVDPAKTAMSASLFSTYALDYVPAGVCWFNEFVGTALLIMVVLAVSDRHSGPPPAGLVPLVIFIVLLAIGNSLGMQTGYALNPARDFGPRIALWMVGYSTKTLFHFRNLYWLWCPIVAPVCGALTGATLYDAFLYKGSESPFNRPSATALKLRRADNEGSVVRELV